MAKKLVAVIGSYRRQGIVHQAVDHLLREFRERGGGVESERIDLLDRNIEFCTNCRACTQEPGERPGRCILNDDMAGIVAALESADYLVFASPVNCFNVTALFHRFMERLICFAYWPWGKWVPRLRIKNSGKKALLISTSAMPGLMQRFFSGAPKALKTTAKHFGAEVTAVLCLGGFAIHEKERLSPKQLAGIAKAVDKLLR
ncbi:MAG: flavodoxin family protein [Deltaproteobacteria bacterium]|nr:flavodoxin family protein [Deltaproteobacteria bacterium]